MSQLGIDRDLAQLGILLPPLLQARSLSDQAADTVRRWLEKEVSTSPPANWEEQLPAAVATAAAIYRDFTEAFFAFFCAATGEGDRAVERALRSHFTYNTERLTDEAQRRILERLTRLLDHFCARYQGSLFRPSQIQVEKIPGYLVRVARIESRKVDLSDPLFHLGGAVELTALPGTDTAPGPGALARNLQDLTRLLARFWNSHGFTERERLEGLVSHLLGDWTGQPQLKHRCRQFLHRRAGTIAAEEERLGRRISQVLAQLQNVEEQLSVAGAEEERARLNAEMSRRKAQLAQLRRRHASLGQRLLPRPAQVKKLLRGHVANASMARFSRIEREVKILTARVENGRTELEQTRPSPAPAVLALLQATETHMAAAPPRRIPQDDHAALEARARWLGLGQQLLDHIRAQLRAVRTEGGLAVPQRTQLESVFMDLELLYDCGLLQHRGLAGALGQYPERQLRHMLRR